MSQQNEETYLEIILSSIKSTSFWSLICGYTGIFALILGGSAYFAFEPLSDLSLFIAFIGAGLVLVSITLSPRAIAIFIVGRRGKYGINVAVMTGAFFIILLIVNFFMYTNPNRIDVTATRVFSLSPQTMKVLDNIDDPVTATVFFVQNSASNNEKTKVADILNEFSRRSDKFSYRFVDPEINRSEALKYNVNVYPSVVFSSESGVFQNITIFNEQEFVTGILISTGIKQKTVYYLTGHGEASLTRDPLVQQVSDDGLDYAIEGMQRDNYLTIPLNLKQYESIPDDASLLIIAGPDQNLDQTEYNILVDYAKSGGRLLILLDPNPPSHFNDLLSMYGLAVSRQNVADAISNVAGQSLTPMLQKTNAQFATSEINPSVNIVDDIAVAFFPDTGVIDAANEEEFNLRAQLNYYPFARTTPVSWLVEPDDDPLYTEEKITGQFTIGGVIEATGRYDDFGTTQSLAKFIVFSDSDFATNKYFYSNDNGDLFLNSVNWLADDFELISIRPKLITYRELVVNSLERQVIKWSSWVIPPLTMIILSFIVWWKRR
jgi:ABC-type uncharacterized transport system involved in gliding motility auxiliary subunit